LQLHIAKREGEFGEAPYCPARGWDLPKLHLSWPYVLLLSVADRASLASPCVCCASLALRGTVCPVRCCAVRPLCCGNVYPVRCCAVCPFFCAAQGQARSAHRPACPRPTCPSWTWWCKRRSASPRTQRRLPQGRRGRAQGDAACLLTSCQDGGREHFNTLSKLCRLLLQLTPR